MWAMASLTTNPPLLEYDKNNLTTSFFSVNAYNASGLSLHIYIFKLIFYPKILFILLPKWPASARTMVTVLLSEVIINVTFVRSIFVLYDFEL